MSDLTLIIKLTDAGLAAVAAAHGQGLQAKITHVAVGDQGYAPDASAVALHHELARVELTAGGAIAPQQVLLQGMIPAGETEFFIRELGYFLEDGTLLGVWSDPVTPLGWIGGVTPWFFKLSFAWASLPANAITVIIADDAGQAGMALDLSQLEGKVRHTVETGGALVWAGDDDTQLTAAINHMIALAVAAVVNASPAALDTLKELATALGNDANFAATMTAALAAKAPLASPALTGTPTAPTAAGGTNTTQLATTAFVQAGLAAKAPLASPALTGAPTAPTAAAGTNTAQLATTAFVQAGLAALVNSSPAALDTLNELAAALGNDANFAATMTAALAAKAPLASPALTGVPTAPTAAGGTNTAQLATTAFVQSAAAAIVGAGGTNYMRIPYLSGGTVKYRTWQWGQTTLSGQVASTVTLPVTATSAVLSVSAVISAGDAVIGSASARAALNGASLTTILLNLDNYPDDYTRTVYWSALTD